MRTALENHQKGPEPSTETIIERLGEISTGAQAQLRGEMSVEAGAAGATSSRRRTRRKR